MAKKNYDIDAMFGEIKERNVETKVEEVVVPAEEPRVEKVVVAQEPEVTTKAEEVDKKAKANKETSKLVNKETSLQANKEKKQPKDYYYGAKHTWTIPDDVWEDIEAYLFLTGEKQVEFVVNCLKEKIEPMRVQIEQVKGLLKARRKGQ